MANGMTFDWLAAFTFAHNESLLAFDAMSHGDFVAAEALLESAKRANTVARMAHAEDQA